jgi:hypothetical protein
MTHNLYLKFSINTHISLPGCLLFAGWVSCRTLSCHLHLLSPYIVPLPHVSILDPPLHLHWLVVALHLITLPPPPVLSSTTLPTDVPPHNVTLATPPPVCLLFAPTACHIASCGITASHPPACHPLHLCLLLCLVFVCPGVLSCCLPSTCHSATATLYCHSRRWLVVASSTHSIICHLLSSSPPSS